MKRTRFGSRDRLSRDAAELQRLATGLSESGGKLEDAYWEAQLADVVDSLLKNGAEDDINTALDRLFEANPRAHDELADMVESRAETNRVEAQGQEYDIQLFAAPVLAWSRFSIPASPLPKSTLQALHVHLGAHVFGGDARIALADFLFSPDQLPRSFCDTWQMTKLLGEAALAGKHLPVDTDGMAETNRFLSDVRYIVGTVVVPRGKPLFRWNEKDGNKETALKEWIKQGSPNIEPLLTGCAWQPLLPDSYHASCRNADRLSRPYSVKASVAFLQSMLALMPADIRAVVGPCYDRLTPAPLSPMLMTTASASARRPVTRSITASSGRCSAQRTKRPTPPAKSKPCCAKPVSRTCFSSTFIFRWNSATTAAPRSSPTAKPNWCTPKCRSNRRRRHKSCIDGQAVER